MPPVLRPPPGLPLRLLLPLLVLLPVLLTAGAVGYFYHGAMRQQLVSAQAKLLEDTSLHVAEHLNQDQQQMRETLRTLIDSPLPTLSTPMQRRAFVPILLGTLRQAPHIQSTYFAYPDGSRLGVRRIDAEFRGRRPTTPAKAMWAVVLEQSPHHEAPYHFLDEDGAELPAPPIFANEYDPRIRPWYQQAQTHDGPIVTEPYRYFGGRRLGITYAQRSPRGGVVAIDADLRALRHLLQELKPTPGSILTLLSHKQGFYASTLPEEQLPPGLWKLLPPTQPGDSSLTATTLGGQAWHAATHLLRGQQQLSLTLLIPDAELFAEGEDIIRRAAWLPLAILALALPLAWGLSLLIARPLRRLTALANDVRALDFTPTPQPHGPVRELNQLQDTAEAMKLALGDFLSLSRQVVAEHPLEHPLETVLDAAMRALPAERGGLWLVDGETMLPRHSAARTGTAPRLGAFPGDARLLHDLAAPCSVPVDATPDGVRPLYAPGDVLTVLPLRLDNGDLLGVMVLAAPQPADDGGHRSRYLGALAGFAAVAVDNRRLAASLQELMNALVKLVADAIDAKSAHTGGHCQRVPLIAQLLAEAAHRAEHGPFADFQLDDKRREALYIASWLHDCGKLTTPDHIIDKGSKLEAPYDRIHEIRMRFEVLKRDAHVAYWQGVAQGGDEATLAAEREQLLQTLDEEFAFVARCNNGDEPVREHDLARLRAIAARRWLRTLDDRLGLGPMEAQRLAAIPPTPAPAYEALLADKPEHRIARPNNEKLGRDNRWGFRLDEPELLYHRGELYNLSIRHGTLSAEERYKVNAHIVETIKMLETLPFPPHLAEVPEIAGGHHERMDGRGYPRAIPGAQMSVLARVMAVADIFEALTAADRPYKPPKTLSQALAIMQKMTAGGHLDPELYRLFLQSRVWLHYAERCLQPEQLDVDDPTPYLPS